MCVVAYLLSLPLWERGFKQLMYRTLVARHLSLPLWERGFKHLKRKSNPLDFLSLPLWERGFKRGVTRKIKNAIERADQGSFYFFLFYRLYKYQTNNSYERRI